MKVNQSGDSDPASLPGPDPRNEWGLEEALDIEYAHAMAPKANIVVVETNFDYNDINQSFDDLFAGASTAASLASVVSMSWGNPESTFGAAGEAKYDTELAGHSGVTFVASSGDSGATGEYPAHSPYVVAVGGTSLFLNSDGSYSSESGWAGSGGGVSTIQTEPSYQTSVQSTGKRTIPDAALDADPATGVPVFDSFDNGSATPWIQLGGTSLAAPAFAGLVAIADEGRAMLGGAPSLTGVSQTLPALYTAPYTDFNDVTTGNNGFAAKPGYDLVTGLGTPKADLLVPDMTAYQLASKMAVTFQPPSSVIAGASFGIVVSAEDTFGDVDTGFNGTATLSLSSNPGGVSFSPVTIAFTNGQAVFSGLTLNKPANGYQFQITSPSFASVSTHAFNVVANPTPNAGTFYPVPTDASLHGHQCRRQQQFRQQHDRARSRRLHA